jgi:hypothetical protein
MRLIKFNQRTYLFPAAVISETAVPTAFGSRKTPTKYSSVIILRFALFRASLCSEKEMKKKKKVKQRKKKNQCLVFHFLVPVRVGEGCGIDARGRKIPCDPLGLRGQKKHAAKGHERERRKLGVPEQGERNICD